MRACTKRSYHSKTKAKLAAKRGPKGLKLRVYKCPHCHTYHLTSQVPRWQTIRDKTSDV